MSAAPGGSRGINTAQGGNVRGPPHRASGGATLVRGVGARFREEEGGVIGSAWGGTVNWYTVALYDANFHHNDKIFRFDTGKNF